MVRPQRRRCVRGNPDFDYFKPNNLKNLKESILTIEEFEALKLKDYENFQEKDAAVKMEISQPTFNRLYNQAKKKLVKAIVEGLAIKIEGGNYKMPNRDGTGPKGEGCKTGRGLGKCEGANQDNGNCSRGNRPRRNCQGRRCQRQE